MECEGALIIWKRSEESRRLRYTEVISDGDSKTITTLLESEPYGSETTIIKHEYVTHVGKRAGKRGRGTKKDVNAHNKAPRAELKVLRATLKGHQKFLREVKNEVKARGQGRGRGRGRGGGGWCGERKGERKGGRKGERKGEGRVEVDSEEEVDDEEVDDEVTEAVVVVTELEIAALQEEIESVQSGMLNYVRRRGGKGVL